ncbi:hypothetical protein [Roseateles depolymerans]|uniref:Uncharacterized protein n=1 Tax=Roseateles depolymerans TaxID=76731 RepID=A0A0U2U3B2_9BURK|nr:hypothetical protein [Roseateles depolymerans]ALV06721.1 hypothetical protein RD2015_2249 [Roseateles depolymerans]REG19698.1 hypothetical protein DES44_2198 [Roseateles depolymerans]
MSSTPSTPSQETLVITPEERAALYFIPQAPGGMIVSEEMQQRLQDKGLATGIREDGRRWLTELGDRVRLGKL